MKFIRNSTETNRTISEVA